MITLGTSTYEVIETKELSRLEIYNLLGSANAASFAEDVEKGLSSPDKFLLPKYFYDAAGSELFEKICRTGEYYPTRTELSIIKKYAEEISEDNSEINAIVELGSGSSYKSKILLEAFLKNRDSLHYIPIDVSDIIIESSKELMNEFTNLNISGFISFYEEGMKMLRRPTSRVANLYGKNGIPDEKKLILFLGSSIGNFSPGEALDYLLMIRKYMNDDDNFVIGFDLIKDIGTLEAAYNDSEGLTAEFNINILRRINNEFGADFDLDNFRHIAFFNEGKSRIEMHLESMCDQIVMIKDIGKEFYFKKGERIHTENSYKFSMEMIKELSGKAGFDFNKYYTDPGKWFALCSFKIRKEK